MALAKSRLALNLLGMDQGEWALAISIVSALLAGGSVFYTRRLAVNDAKRMRRKHLVVEVTSRPSDRYSGWHEGQIVVRNLEPVAARITGLRARRRRDKLLSQQAAFKTESENFWEPEHLPHLPETKASNRISLSYSVGPVGSVRSQGGFTPGATQYVSFYASRSVGPADVLLEWGWADGERL